MVINKGINGPTLPEFAGANLPVARCMARPSAPKSGVRMMRTEIEALEQFYAAINRNDMQAITKHFDPQIVRIEPGGFPTAGTYRGITEVQDHVREGRGTWAEGTCEPQGNRFLKNEIEW